jgi:hypothetical protein
LTAEELVVRDIAAAASADCAVGTLSDYQTPQHVDPDAITNWLPRATTS